MTPPYATVAPTTISQETVFLVSGGARGITAHCVIALARRFRSTFILVGRTSIAEPIPAWATVDADEATLKRRILAQFQQEGRTATPQALQKHFQHLRAQAEILTTVQTMEATGATVVYLCADVSDAAALEHTLAPVLAKVGPVTALLHGAGALADRRIEQKRVEDFATVYQSKVTGLQNLLRAVDLGRLQHLILFSSAAGFYGNPGQTDYALANEILNKIAHQVKGQHPHCQVLALDWGPWDGGMVTAAHKRHFAARNVTVIPLAAGTQLLVDALEEGSATASGQSIQWVVGSSLPATPPWVGNGFRPRYQIRRVLSAAANPFLRDHVIGEHAVLPTVCAVAWIANTAEQLYPGLTLCRCENFKVLKGIVFDHSLAAEYWLDVEEVNREKNHEGEVRLQAMILSKTAQGQTRYHYSAHLLLRQQLPPAPIGSTNSPLGLIGTAVGLTGALNAAAKFYEDGTLFHGPAFRGVQQLLTLDRQGLSMACRLPRVSEAEQGQFPVQSFNPFIADVQFQCMVIWVRQIYGAASLPLATAVGEQFHPIGFDEPFYVNLAVQSSSETGLVANIDVYNAAGILCTRLQGAEVTVLLTKGQADKRTR